MMKSSCRAGLHRELLNSTPSAFHPAKRISGMHLKPYLKFQKKERPLEISPDPPRTPPMSQERLANEEKPNRARPGLLPTRPLWKALEGVSPNTICGGNRGGSPVEGPSVKERRAALPATIHQGDDGEGPLDIWAVVKPGNTKEKIAFFAGQQCSDHRVSSSMKNKSTWDIDRRATKRRKKSLDLKKAKIQLERMREASGRCYQPEPFACGIEHCSVHNVNDGGEGGFPSRPLSVVEMVAFLEQRASVLLVGCAKNCPSASAVTRCPGPPKGASPAPGPFPILVAYEAHSEKEPGGGGGSDGEQPGEPVRVLDMVAKLESECLRHQSEREAGSLSRNNSFRRNVGRVLLASGVPPENEAGKGAAEALHGEERGGEEKEGEEEAAAWRSKRGPLEEGLSAAPLPTSFPEGLSGTGGLQLEPGDSAPSGKCPASQKIAKLRHVAARPEAAQPSPRSLQSQNAAVACTPKEPVALPNLNCNVRARESLSISIYAAKTEKGYRETHPASSGFGQDSLPGRLFLLLSECEVLPERVPSGEAPAEECQGKAASPGGDPISRVAGEPPGSPSESALQVPDSSRLRRQRSHDFLETRFKIQQLLEPQQYLAFLPHHIIVKIFGLLPTQSLVALKCTCGYFKFIIEYYNIRPADSRWVRDPRYREDPCKQCKKKYSKGDVSLCRWHPKPYCQALPYGPGYWMCCHRSQKSVPGCKLGLHDNHWVPACHSFNRTLHKKPRETEDDC